MDDLLSDDSFGFLKRDGEEDDVAALEECAIATVCLFIRNRDRTSPRAEEPRELPARSALAADDPDARLGGDLHGF